MKEAAPAWAEALTAEVVGLRKDTRELDRAIRGDGDKTGLVGRVKAVEDAQERAQWWARTALGSAIGAVVVAVWAALTGAKNSGGA